MTHFCKLRFPVTYCISQHKHAESWLGSSSEQKLRQKSMTYGSVLYKRQIQAKTRNYAAETVPFGPVGSIRLSNANPWKMITSTSIKHEEPNQWAKSHFFTRGKCVLTGGKKCAKGTMGILSQSACGLPPRPQSQQHSCGHKAAWAGQETDRQSKGQS